MAIYVNARFVTQPLTGVQRYAYEICRHLKCMDENIIFLSPRNICRFEWAKKLQVKIIGRLKGHLWEQSELPLFLSRQRQAILFSPCNTGPLFYKRQMLTLHDLSFKIFPAFNSFLFRHWYNFLISRLMQEVQHIFTVSETVKKEIMEYYHVVGDHITVTYNGVADDMMPLPAANALKEKLVLTVGSLSARKNIDFLIRGFLSSGLSPAYTLAIIGNANPIYNFKQTDKVAGIQIIEDADDTVLKNFYAKAGIACFLSVYEGFGIPVLEALQYDCKVICADIPVFRELYEGYVTYCDPHNEQQLAGLLQAVPSMETLQEGRVQALNEKYDYQRSASLIYQKLSQA